MPSPALIAITLALMTGCAAVTPTVQYRELHSSADMAGMADAFALQASAIVIEKPRTASDALKISSVRAPRRMSIRDPAGARVAVRHDRELSEDSEHRHDRLEAIV